MLIEFSRDIFDGLHKLTYQDVADMFKVSVPIDSAEKIDANRYYCSSNRVDYYYAMLETFFSIHNIPSSYNDEEGHDEYVDTKEKELVVVPKECDKKLFFPVQRKEDNTTFVACIAADGSYLRPLIVVKRKTIEARILRLSMCDKIKIKYEETGYINSDVFNAWVKDVFIPNIIERRKKYNYSGQGVLIIDGCHSHYTKVLYDSCNYNNIKIMFIPPHSSNQTQMLVLSMFHVHKENVRQARLFDIDNADLLMDKIEMLYDSFQREASPPKIKAAFAATGAVYEVSEHYQYLPIVRFSINFTTQIWHCQRSNEEKAYIREKSKGKSKTEIRLKLDDFDKISPFWERPQVTEVIKKMPKFIDFVDLMKKDIFYRVLNSIITFDKIANTLNDIQEIKRGRPKKEENEIKDIDEIENEEMRAYIQCTFNQRLMLELEILELIPENTK